MKVTNNPLNHSQLVDKAKGTDRAPEGPLKATDLAPSSDKTVRGATVEISDRAKLMKQATDIAHQTPDIRKEKIAALKKSIHEGTYHVDSGAIADRLVEEHLGSDFGKNRL